MFIERMSATEVTDMWKHRMTTKGRSSFSLLHILLKHPICCDRLLLELTKASRFLHRCYLYHVISVINRVTQFGADGFSSCTV